ncbi:hypothetical protein T484DRAFT_1917361, partial [Baffinella frigidus]
ERKPLHLSRRRGARRSWTRGRQNRGSSQVTSRRPSASSGSVATLARGPATDVRSSTATPKGSGRCRSATTSCCAAARARGKTASRTLQPACPSTSRHPPRTIRRAGRTTQTRSTNAPSPRRRWWRCGRGSRWCARPPRRRQRTPRLAYGGAEARSKRGPAVKGRGRA